MKTINIHAAKTNLSRLVDEAADGKPFIIAKNGKPKVKVVPIDALPEKKVKRIGFLEGQISVPDDFDTLMSDEIEKMFYGGKK